MSRREIREFREFAKEVLAKQQAAQSSQSTTAQKNVNLDNMCKVVAETFAQLNNNLINKNLISEPISKANLDQAINEINGLKINSDILLKFNNELVENGFNAANSKNIVETVNTFKAYQVNSTLFSELNDNALKIGLNAPIDQYNIDDSINTLVLESAKADGFDIATISSGLRGKNDTFDHIGSVVKQTLDHIIDYCTPKHGTNNTLCIDICESGFNFNNAWDDCA
ncbi:hypothetical protein NF27_IN00410 [Candidatus Jidaibacter acanthamoeba]|uniref:Uncharacterized protein n=1 Tax=Candidatus Jidaibacter acanthamoebae TaxID=86105 RepID=A0A0C1QWB6_9RICK|nr:hypothetical protein [Candidatus Jidaibacter acanthamoeba]KIE04300.1 hypothetical protein NF27_IN00410 [Candidatus Jidaibacter acanthamoeba]